MSKTGWSLVTLVMVVSLLFGALGCANPSPALPPTTAPTSAPSVTPTTAPPVAPTPGAPAPKSTPGSATTKPILLKFALHSSAPVSRAAGLEWWAKEVEKRSEGRVKIEMFWGASLLPMTEIPKGIKVGLADIGETSITAHPGEFPLSNLTQMPRTTSDYLAVVKAWREVYDTFPEVRAEFTRFNQMNLFWQPTQDYHVQTIKPYSSIKEMKGLKVRVFGVAYPKILAGAASIVPVSIAATEVYEGLLRGTVQGCLSTQETAYRYKWYEVAPYMILWSLGTAATPHTTINLDTWKKLPADIQQIMIEAGKEQEVWIANLYKAEETSQVETMKKSKKGYEIIKLPPEDMAVIDKVVAPMWDETGAELEAKGLPGKKILEVYKTSLRKHEKAS